ncbi:hypothetical protein FGIG_09758 [Fasciola gigantica]|uniref:Uncharacterized protein n=1 Tax=Fasciola gigantica TaxID=46835 RepID=A0A504YJC7_FASGI|nr:hypothetical protein FGIG_09758 [Fasciola gigantica]
MGPFSQQRTWFTAFCSPRPLANCLEWALTTVALTTYPVWPVVQGNLLADRLRLTWVLFHQLANWFTAFCSPRPLANCLEWALTTVALTPIVSVYVAFVQCALYPGILIFLMKILSDGARVEGVLHRKCHVLLRDWIFSV